MVCVSVSEQVSKADQPSSKRPLLTAAVQVAVATPAYRRVRGNAADIRAVMPAAFTFGMRRRCHLNRQVVTGFELQRRHDEHKLQVTA